jgi:hypothetical protein
MTTIWELDFYSRPLVDENGKKLWEVLICETPAAGVAEGFFQYSEYCANSSVNSIWLGQAIEKAILESGQTPDRIRFFRQSMNNMITKACGDLGIPALPSRRTFALSTWLQERIKSVYPSHPSYQAGSNASVVFPKTPPQPLPDALRGQKWQFVSLEASMFAEMGDWSIAFGESFSLEAMGVGADAVVPGLVIYSPRATAMAAWMSGLELAAVRFDTEGGPAIVLETGVLDRWTLTPLPLPELQLEATRFESDKALVGDVHFLALQESPDVEAFAGFWMLRDVSLM